MENIGGEVAEVLSKKRDGLSGGRWFIVERESKVGEDGVCVKETLRCHHSAVENVVTGSRSVYVSLALPVEVVVDVDRGAR
jgi:hypothetical protein